MLVALATSQIPAHLPPDERALVAALEDIGISSTAEIWSSNAADWSKFDAVVVRSCWDYHLRVDEFRRWIGTLMKLNIPVFNPPGLILWNLDKRYLQELARGGIAIPETVWIADGEYVDLLDTRRAHGWQTAVVKPLISASAYRTERKREGTVRGPAMIQEYLTAIETQGEWSLIYFESEFSHAVRKRAPEGDFRVQSDFGGTAELETPPPQVLHAADAVMTRLPQPPLFARVDMVEHGGSALLMELELIEPELFLTLAPESSRGLACAVQSAITKA